MILKQIGNTLIIDLSTQGENCFSCGVTKPKELVKKHYHSNCASFEMEKERERERENTQRRKDGQMSDILVEEQKGGMRQSDYRDGNSSKRTNGGVK